MTTSSLRIGFSSTEGLLLQSLVLLQSRGFITAARLNFRSLSLCLCSSCCAAAPTRINGLFLVGATIAAVSCVLSHSSDVPPSLTCRLGRGFGGRWFVGVASGSRRFGEGRDRWWWW